MSLHRPMYAAAFIFVTTNKIEMFVVYDLVLDPGSRQLKGVYVIMEQMGL